MSFRALEDDGFKSITEDLFDAVGMKINRAVVKSHITHSAVSITQIIQDKQKKDRQFQNVRRRMPVDYNEGEIVLVKNKQIMSKHVNPI